MIGLFLPRLRVVSLLHRPHNALPARRNSPSQPVVQSFRNGPLALIRNTEQDRRDHVSAPL